MVKKYSFRKYVLLPVLAGSIMMFNGHSRKNNSHDGEKNIVDVASLSTTNMYSMLTIDDYVKAITKIESNNNPKAKRYEKHLNDTSYGLGQILTSTAKELEKKNVNLPALGKNSEEIKNSLCNPDINLQYTRTLYSGLLDKYDGDNYAPGLAVAAYNSGPNTPRNALYQRMLNVYFLENDRMKEIISEDGHFGKKTRSAVRVYQKENQIPVSGKFDEKTLDSLYRFSDSVGADYSRRKGLTPNNTYTPNHVEKFNRELRSILEEKLSNEE